MAAIFILLIILGSLWVGGSIYWRFTTKSQDRALEIGAALILVMGTILLLIGILGLTNPPGDLNANSKASPICLVWADDKGG